VQGEMPVALLEMAVYSSLAMSHAWIEDIRRTMDLCMACEYNESELPNASFNQAYYGSFRRISYGYPSSKRRAQLKRDLRTARLIVDSSYHDCKPLDKLHDKFDKALKMLDKWPLSIKTPGSRKRKLPPGTFVRLDHNDDVVGIVFSHDTSKEIVTGYSEAGHFLVGSHEVTIMKKQPPLRGFRPMRLYLPYCKWTCADGREVLFNRDYNPIWQRSADGVVSPIQPDTHINYNKSEHYYNDRTTPYGGDDNTLKKCRAVLEEWNVVHQFPVLFDRLPDAIERGDARLLSPKGCLNFKKTPVMAALEIKRPLL